MKYITWCKNNIRGLMMGLLMLMPLHGGWCAQAKAASARTGSKEPIKANSGEVKPAPKPTAANVSYGSDPSQRLDFWKAKSDRPTPVLFFIHGGGWMGGDKQRVNDGTISPYLKAGISVVSINYRFISAAQVDGAKPPVKWPLGDAARALQFVRSKAAEWGLDKNRIGASGGSAGACSSLWLAFHDDMADPKSADPVARESTRLSCAGVMNAQTSLDPRQMREWIPNSIYGGHAFGFRQPEERGRAAEFQRFYDGREQILPWIKEYSPYELARAGAPPIFLEYTFPLAADGRPEINPTHSARFGIGLKKKLDAIGVPCQLTFPGSPPQKYTTAQEFLIYHLRMR